MKKIIITSIIALLAFGNISMKKADEIKWLGFNEGYALAKKKNKIMLVDVYTDWCGWCKRMDRDAYAKNDISSIVSKDYVAVKFNPEVAGITYTYNGKKYDGQGLAGAISNNSISGYPTTIFIYPKQNKTAIVVGYKDAEGLKPILEDYKKQFYGKK